MNDALFKSWNEIEEEEKELTSAYEGGFKNVENLLGGLSDCEEFFPNQL